MTNRFQEQCRSAAAAGGWFGEYVDVKGEPVHFVQRGAGDVLLLLHGFMAWSYTWRHNMAFLSSHARVIALDLRGFGLSSRSALRGHSLDDQVEFVRNFMDAVGVERAVVCGNSMGGEIALRLALSHPDRVRALILVSTAGLIQRKSRSRIERIALSTPGIGPLLLRVAVMNRRFAEQALRAAYFDSSLVTAADVAAYLLPARVPGSAPVLLRMLRDSDFGRTADRLGEINQPVLLVWGEADPWIPPEHGQQLAALLRGSQLLLVPECGHVPHEECPDTFNAAVIQFLRTLDQL